MRTQIHLSATLFSAKTRAAASRGWTTTASPAAPSTFTARRSAGLVLFHGNGGVDVASASCVRIAERCFLATAGHNLEGIARDRDLRIVPPRSSRDRWLPFLGRNATRRRDPDSHDVGWIELDPAVAREAGLKFLDAGTLLTAACAAPGPQAARCAGARYLVHGLPARLAIHGLHARGRILHLTLLGYRTLAREAEPEGRLGRLSLCYDWTESEGGGARGGLFRGRLPAAHGLSGGGIWQVDRRPGTAGPEPPRLVAIVRGWHRRERRLSSVSIARWLALVRGDFPELGRTIDPLLGDTTR